VDVFGPVSRPYVAITPDDGVSLPALVGEKLYAR
jgi:RNA-binding protein